MIALNPIRLVLLGLGGPLYFLGLGWLAAGPALRSVDSDINMERKFPMYLITGILVNYSLVLLVRTLSVSLAIGAAFSAVGLLIMGTSLYRSRGNGTIQAPRWPAWVAAGLICLILLIPILAEPLKAWDARGIWFFHARIIYHARSIWVPEIWKSPDLAHSHTDYPIMVPVMAAQTGYLMKFWNEYFPKLSIFFMLLPGIVWLFSFAKKSISFVTLILLVPFSFSVVMWDGYMDGYLALYFAIALLLLGRYIESKQPIDLFSSAICLLLLPNIKNEGVLAMLAGLVSLGVIWLIQHRVSAWKKTLASGRGWFMVLSIAALPSSLWGLYKQLWGLGNDLQLGTAHSLQTIFMRLADGSLGTILGNIYSQAEGAILLLGLALVAIAFQKKPFPRQAIPALVSASIFCMGLVLVYLLTPHDLVWHINTSIDRVMLSVNGSLYVAMFFILSTVEQVAASAASPQTADLK